MRFSFDGFWIKKKLNDICIRITRKNKKLESTLPLTISAEYGLVDQETFFNRKVASNNIEGYYLLYNGEFAYNKSYSNNYPWGAIKRLDLYDKGVISTLYICFKPKDVINSDYLTHYFESTKWHNQISEIAVEGARNHGLLNIPVNDFFNTSHMFPTYEEQLKLTTFLNLIQSRINTQKKIIDLLESQINQIRKQLIDDIEQDNNFIPLSKIIVEYTNKTNINNMYPVLSSTKSGIHLQTEYFNKEASSDDTTGYKIIPRGYCTYRSMSDTGEFTFNIQNILEYGIVSPAYPVFTTKYLNEFVIGYLNHSSKLRYNILSLKEGGTRFALSLKKLMNLEIPLVPLNEQNDFIKVLNKFNNKIKNEKQILLLYEQQKQYLLDKIFI